MGRRAIGAVLSGWALLTVSALPGCGERALTEDDCVALRKKVEAAWNRDAVAAQRIADTNEFNPFIRDEGERLGAAVLEDCRGMVGRSVKEEELACLDAADTIDDVYECSPR